MTIEMGSETAPPGSLVSSETGLACLFRLGVQNGVYAEVGAVRRRNLIDGEVMAAARLAELAGEFGLDAAPAQLDWTALRTRPFRHPLLLILDNRNVVILMGLRRDGEDAAVSDPLHREGEVFFVGRGELERAWSGAALIVTPRPPAAEAGGFGFSWFTKKLFAERRLLRDIVAAALAMNLIALAVPIFFQLLVDKVIPNQALATLYALTAGVGALVLFDGGFNYLRNYLLSFITRRLDRAVANDTIAHLLRLPIDYFHANLSGVIAYKQLRQQIAETAAERAAFVAQWQRKLAGELAKTRAERDGVAAQLKKAQLRRTLAVLRAPAAATVLAVADRPQGAVVTPAEPLFRLIPLDSPLIAEIDVETHDVARLKPGDPVTVKFEALPWEQFGLVRGVLKTLAPDTEPDKNLAETAHDIDSPQLKQAERESPIHYRARVELTRRELRNLPPGFVMRPGMRLVAEIKVGRRSLLQYILNPITRIADDSLHEP